MLNPRSKLALYMENAIGGPSGKMGFGVLRYSQNPIVCVIDSTKAGQDIATLTGIHRTCPIVSSIEEAVSLGSQVLILGIAPLGGEIPDEWWPDLDRAVSSGLSIVNGLHDLVGPHYPDLVAGPNEEDRQFVWDIRIEPSGLTNGKGLAAGLSCRRVLLIGSDMAIGKMTAGLEIHRRALESGIKSGFVATGQIGITLTGAGIPLDAIRIDFASGAVEAQVLRHADQGAELVVVEGQGSLIHPSSSANLPLIRGTCPTHYIFCHRSGQTHLKNLPDHPIPALGQIIELYEDLGAACGEFARPKTVGVALNTAHLDAAAAEADCLRYERELGIPCVDPIRHGTERLLQALMA